MSAPMFPELGAAPALSCSRLGCTADATWHVIHDLASMENGLACDQHMAEFGARNWRFDAAHAYALDCSHPRAIYVVATNRCLIVDEATHVAIAEWAEAKR